MGVNSLKFDIKKKDRLKTFIFKKKIKKFTLQGKDP